MCELSARVFWPLPDKRNKLNKQRKAGSKVFFHLLFSLSRLVATANICNVVLMRNHELLTGIEVKEKDGNVVGTSKIAARKVNTVSRYKTVESITQSEKLTTVYAMTFLHICFTSILD